MSSNVSAEDVKEPSKHGDGYSKKRRVNSTSVEPRERRELKHPTMIQISTEELTALLTATIAKTLGARMENLESAVNTVDAKLKSLNDQAEVTNMSLARLGEKLSNIQAGVRTLHESQGAFFFRFLDLPVELQIMVWRFALKEPSILVLKRTAFSDEVEEPITYINGRAIFAARGSKCFHAEAHGPLFMPFIKRKDQSAVRQVCRRARAIAIEYQTVDEQTGIYDPSKYGKSYPPVFTRQPIYATVYNPDVYISKETETVWMLGSPKGRKDWCYANSSDGYLRFILRTLVPGSILKLAISWAQWSLELEIGLAGFMSSIKGVRELTIVVGPTDSAYSEDLMFAEPGETLKPSWISSYSAWRQQVEGIIFAHTGQRAQHPFGELEQYSWFGMAAEIKTFIARYQTIQARQRKLKIRQGIAPEILDKNENLRDCSGWTVDSVRLVRATTPLIIRREQANSPRV